MIDVLLYKSNTGFLFYLDSQVTIILFLCIGGLNDLAILQHYNQDNIVIR